MTMLSSVWSLSINTKAEALLPFQTTPTQSSFSRTTEGSIGDQMLPIDPAQPVAEFDQLGPDFDQNTGFGPLAKPPSTRRLGRKRLW